MLKTFEAFDDFVDDCFFDGDPLCNSDRGHSLGAVASQLISGTMEEEGAPKTCLVSLMLERKVT